MRNYAGALGCGMNLYPTSAEQRIQISIKEVEEMTPDDFVKVINERNAEPTNRPKVRVQPPDSRPVGLIVSAVGLAGIGFCGLTIDQALNHAPEIMIYWKTLLISLPIFLIGLRWVIWGRKAPEIFGPPYSPTRGAKIYFIACLITGPVSAYAYVHYLSLLGYVLR